MLRRFMSNNAKADVSAKYEHAPAHDRGQWPQTPKGDAVVETSTVDQKFDVAHGKPNYAENAPKLR